MVEEEKERCGVYPLLTKKIGCSGVWVLCILHRPKNKGGHKGVLVSMPTQLDDGGIIVGDALVAVQVGVEKGSSERM